MRRNPLARQKLSLGLVLVLLAACLLMLALAFAGYRSPSALWHSLFAGPTDGSWTAISIDGKPIEPERYRIGIAGGEVAGGRDDCNDWGYADDEGATEDGDRMIVSTLVGCPEDDPIREAYWALVHAPQIQLRPDGKLRVSARGHEAILIRCEWQQVRESLPGGGISDMARCLPVEQNQ